MSTNNTNISPKAVVGRNLVIGQNSVVEDGVKIGENATIGRNVIIKKGVTIGSGCNVEDNVILGYSNLTRRYEKNANFEKTVIGDGALLRPGSVVYIGCEIGAGCKIGHNVVIREGTIIKNNTSLGCLVKCEGYAVIGSNCSIHSLSSISPFTVIEDFVFIGPGMISVNDATIDYARGFEVEKKGPHIKYGARIGGNSTICPAVTIGIEAFIAAGSLVARDVPDYCKAAGSPARVIGRVSEKERIQNDIPQRHGATEK